MSSWGSRPNFRLTCNRGLTFCSFHFPSLSVSLLSLLYLLRDPSCKANRIPQMYDWPLGRHCLGSCYARGAISTFTCLLPFCFLCRYLPILLVYLTYSGLLVYH
ncbi:hypothetical protein C8J56DRAFT_948699 [Mycena floridula]|nr:hypothetical protein C8J56DRAFT_948699 [Mycena floridula]